MNKVTCPTCRNLPYYGSDSNKRITCPTCGGVGFLHRIYPKEVIELSTIEAITEIDKDKNEVYEVVLTSGLWFKALYLFMSYNIAGNLYLICLEEPLETQIPHVMKFRKEIPMDAKWVKSEKTKSHLDDLLEALGRYDNK